MDFKQKKRNKLNENNYHLEHLHNARKFSKELLEEMNDLVKSIVIFGSTAQNKDKKNSDIDLMIVLDNISVYVTPELREAYKIITEKITTQIGANFHLFTINLTDLWDMARKCDPVLINILRFGYPLFDRDLVEPLQYLLEIGKIKPTRETVTNYSVRSQTLFKESSKHIEEAILDLYYSSIDSLHAALMCKKVLPSSPKEMPELFKKNFSKEKSLIKHLQTIKNIYKLAKDIEYKKIKIDGKLYDSTKKEVEKLISDLEKLTKKELSKKDSFEL